jgi:hypothetical protein
MKKLTFFLAIALITVIANVGNAAVIDILVNDLAWQGEQVRPSDIITVTFVNDDGTQWGGFGDFTINVSNGDLYEGTGWVDTVALPMAAFIMITPKTEGYDVLIGGSAFGATPAGPLAGWEFHVPDYKQESDYIIIDPISGSFDGVGAIPGPDDPFPYIVLHVIPEPMTVALLGLGGLFLLRRRK